MRMKKRFVSILTATRSAIGFVIGLLVLLSTSCAYWAEPKPAAVAAKVQRNIVFGRPDGAKLKMDLYFPPGGAGRASPVVMYVHGGGWRMGSKAMVSMMPGPSELLRRGYVVASINYRLAPKYKFPAMIEDAKCVVRFLRAHAKEFNLDPNRIGVMGDSSGGHLVALLGLTDSHAGFDGQCDWSNATSRVQAVVDLYGPSDFTSKSNLNQTAISLVKTAFGATNADDPILKRASPVTYVSSNAPPFLILHGDHDGLVPLQQSEELYERLKAAGDSATFIVITNFSHGYTPFGLKSSPNFAGLSKIIADFFDKNLQWSKPDELHAQAN
jgi:acetyl esterase/lipase